MAESDVALRATQETEGEGMSEGGVQSAHRQQRRRRCGDAENTG